MDDSESDADPSGLPLQSTTPKRKRYSVQEKLFLVRTIRRRIEYDEITLRKACSDANIHHKQFLSWSKNIKSIEEAKKKNTKAKSLCSGVDFLVVRGITCLYRMCTVNHPLSTKRKNNNGCAASTSTTNVRVRDRHVTTGDFTVQGQ
jgi:hypothetical protein